jgi:hypothetical protein
MGAIGLAEKIAAAGVEAITDMLIEVGGKLKEDFAVGATDGQPIGERQGVSGVGHGLSHSVIEVEEDV